MTALANNTVWYVGSTKYAAAAAWAASTAYAAGALVRQLATPTAGNERVFACIVAGTSLSSEPTWVVTKGAKTAEAAGPTWQEVTGQPGVCGDTTNSPAWGASLTTTLGQIIYDATSGALQIVTTAGTTKSLPAPTFSATAGATTTDNTTTWTSLGAHGNFAAYAAPHARLRNAFASTWGAAGNTFYVSNNHAATEAAPFSLIAPGTAASPNTVLCVNDSAAPPTATATTASETTTGTGSISISSGFGYFYGITFSAGTGSGVSNINLNNAVSATGLYFDTCGLTLGGTGASNINYGGATSTTADCFIELRNCTYVFGAAGQAIKFGSSLGGIIGGTFAASGTVPGNAFVIGSGPTTLSVRDLDLSAVTSQLVSGGGSAIPSGVVFQNCKIASGVTPMSAQTIGAGGTFCKLHNCDSGAINYHYLSTNYLGTVQHETATIRTGGASDGTTPLSWKMISSANTKPQQPLVSEDIAMWQDTTGSSKTASIEITTSATLTNADCWLEIEYLGSAGSPLGSIVTTKVALLATPTTLTTSAASWANAQTNTYKLSATFTPQMKGPIKARLLLAKAGTTVYADPLLTVV